MRGQSGTASEVEASGETIVLDQCFPSCDPAPAPPPPPPPVAYSGHVEEVSYAEFGTPRNGGVAGATVILSSDATGDITLTTDGSGNYGGTYQPPADPAVAAYAYGLGASACCASSTLNLYTDVVMKLGLTGDSAPAAQGASFTITGAANGAGGASTAKPLYVGSPTAIVVPRNQGGGASTITVTGAETPHFTWFGEGGLSLSQSGPTGGYASGSMSFRAMHKYIKVIVTLEPPGGLPVPPEAVLQNYVFTDTGYAASDLFQLPTAYDLSNNMVSQSNPSAPGALSEWVLSANRLSGGGATYQDKFKIHVDAKQMYSDPTNGNEDVAVTDDARISGVIHKTIKLLLKDIAK